MAHVIEEWLQRRRWAVAVSALALITVAILPPRSDVGDRLPESGPMMLWHLLLLGDHYSGGSTWFRARSLDAARRGLRTRLAELRFADSVTAEVARGRGLRTRDGSVALLYPRGYPADSARMLVSLLEQELASHAPGSNHGAPVVVTVVRDVRAALGFSARVRRFSVAGDRPACFVAVELRRVPLPATTNGSIALDWCALYARYGTPGPEIRARIESRGPWLVERDHWLSDAVERARARSWPATFLPDAFEGDACRAGSEAMCERLLQVPAVAVRLRQRSWEGVRILQRGFIGMLLVERGPDRFEAFWRSRADLPTAIEQAYGEPSGQLLHAWSLRIAGPRRTGPVAVPWAQAAGIGWIAVAIGLAVLALKRQEVGR